jgi:hypothetical protein
MKDSKSIRKINPLGGASQFVLNQNILNGMSAD